MAATIVEWDSRAPSPCISHFLQCTFMQILIVSYLGTYLSKRLSLSTSNKFAVLTIRFKCVNYVSLLVL